MDDEEKAEAFEDVTKVRAMASFAREQFKSDGVLIVSFDPTRMIVIANGTEEFRDRLPVLAQMVAGAVGAITEEMEVSATPKH